MGETEKIPHSKWENSSLHGPPLVCQSEHTVEKLFWILVIILSVAMFSFEASVILKQYQDDPIAVTIRTKQPTKWPKFAFCPQNWISETKLAEHGANTTEFKCAILGSLASWSNRNQQFLITTCSLYKQQWQNILYKFSQTTLGKMDAVSLFKEISYDIVDLFYTGSYTITKEVAYKSVCYHITFTNPFLLFGDAGKPMIFMKEKSQPLHLDMLTHQEEALVMQRAAAAQQHLSKNSTDQAQLEPRKSAAEAIQHPQQSSLDTAQNVLQNSDSPRHQKPEHNADDICLFNSGETLEFQDYPKIKTYESPLILIREEEYIRVDSKSVRCGNVTNDARMSTALKCIEIGCAKMGLKRPLFPGYNSGKPMRLSEYANLMNFSSHCFAANWDIAIKIIRNCFKQVAPPCKSSSYLFSTYPTNDPSFSWEAGTRVPTITFGYYNAWGSQTVTEFKIYTWDTLVCNLGGMLSLFTGASLFSLVQLVILCIPTLFLKNKVENQALKG